MFSSDLHHAITTPYFKTDNHVELSNYRPLCKFISFSKVERTDCFPAKIFLNSLQFHWSLASGPKRLPFYWSYSMSLFNFGAVKKQQAWSFFSKRSGPLSCLWQGGDWDFVGSFVIKNGVHEKPLSLNKSRLTHPIETVLIDGYFLT